MTAFVLSEVAAYLLTTARVAGVVLVSPFPGKNVPPKAKIGLILMLAFLARAALAPVASFSLDRNLVGLVVNELGIGLVIGFTVRVTFSSAEVLGASLAQSTGLTMGQAYDPTLGSEEPVPARIVSLFAMLLFFAVGAHRVALGYTLASFRALPVGQGVAIGAAAPSFVGFFADAMDAGVRMSLPVMAIALVIQVTLALVARASPSLQVFSIGMGISVAAGLLAILGSMDDLAAGIGAELGREGPRLEQVLRVLPSHGAAADTQPP